MPHHAYFAYDCNSFFKLQHFAYYIRKLKKLKLQQQI